MPGDRLHDYDLWLCDYAAGNVRQYLREPDFARWIRGGLPPRLETYLWEGLGSDEPVRLLLDDQELTAIELLLADPPPGSDWTWEAYAALHAARVDSVREVRDELSRRDAEDWARACSRYGRRLERGGLRLHEGVAVVGDWVRHLRRLLGAIGAVQYLPYPGGVFPTPTVPTPPLVPPVVDAALPDAAAPISRSAMAPAATIEGAGAPDDPHREVLVAVNEMRELLVSQRQVRDYYSTDQVAAIMGRANWTVREWCRLGRVNAEKRQSGRGRSFEWVIPHAELLRIQKEGLLPLPKH